MFKLFKYKKNKNRKRSSFSARRIETRKLSKQINPLEITTQKGFRLACVDHFIGFTKAENVCINIPVRI